MKDIRSILEKNPELRQDLFVRGFLITDKLPETDGFPFYGNFDVSEHCGYYFIAHKKMRIHVLEKDGGCFFIAGHSYNPFTMETDETEQLKLIAENYGTEQYLERISDLTGIFVYGDIVNGTLNYLVDPSGMQSACYAKINGSFYISSHPQLIGDINGLEMDSFVKELIGYKWYGRVMGPYLPADLTPFSEVKRIVPSIIYHYNGEITHERYWPLENIDVVKREDEYKKVIEDAAEILKRNMELVSRKWKKPCISLTGGIDSNTTFAAANGIYERFESFSYVSAEKEVPDAAAAKQIAESFSVKHKEYHIPDSSEGIRLYDEKLEILRHNNGYVADPKANEARKRMYLRDNCDFDVEVKSWTSETIRAYWYKHFGRKRMPRLSAKLYRNLYKIFILNRSLAHKVDKLFAEYIKKFEYEKIPKTYSAADIHYNEVTWGSWGGLNISEMKYCFDITIIYNNRRFLDLLFRVPLEKRISDEHHLDIKKHLNKELYDMNIRVVNLKETKFRAFALNAIFTVNSWLPF